MTIIKSPLFTLLVALLSGCAFQGMVADSFESLVDTYCEIPQDKRFMARNTINASTYPNKVFVECADEKGQEKLTKSK